MSVKRSIDSPLGRALSMALMAGLMLLIVGQASAEPVPLAVGPLNVADDGVASVYQTTGGGLVTPVANANDTEFTGDIENNLLTITGDFLGIQVDLAGASDLSELSAYVDPTDPGTDPFKNTDSVEFLISIDSGVSFSSVGFGSFSPGALGAFSYVNVIGNFVGVTNVRYLFHQADSGAEGQRIPEVLALLPDDDGDGVPNNEDNCADTPEDEVVDEEGCSINQLCPCDDPWKNHGNYVSCVTHAAEDFLGAGLISEEEKDAIVSEAGQSDCGK